MTTIRVDWENNGEEWWAAVEEWARGSYGEDKRAQFARAIFAIGDGMVLPDSDVEGFAEWAESLPGWDDGPDYAPHPLSLVAGGCDGD